MARERFSGQELREELRRIQKRLDSVELLTPDIVINLLLSFRDVQVGVDNMEGRISVGADARKVMDVWYLCQV